MESKFITNGNTFRFHPKGEMVRLPHKGAIKNAFIEALNDWEEVERVPAGSPEGGQWMATGAQKYLTEVTKNPLLKEWNVDVESINKEGDYILYHGTTQNKSTGILAEGLKSKMDEPGWFMLSTKKEASKEFAKGYDDGSGYALLEVRIPVSEITKTIWPGSNTGNVSAVKDTEHAIRNGLLDKKYIHLIARNLKIKNDWSTVERAPAGTSEGGQWTSGDYSDVTLELWDGSGNKLKRLPRWLSKSHALQLVGLPKDYKGSAEITFDTPTNFRISIVSLNDDGTFAMTRSINAGEKTIENMDITLSGKWKGMGAKIFNDQVEYAAKNGYKEIFTTASGSGKNIKDGIVGYYTWARLGYTPSSSVTTLEGKERKFTDIFIQYNKENNNANIKSLTELVSTKHGQEWWKKNGSEWPGVFDLSEGSFNRKVLKNYMNDRAKRK